MLWLTSQIVPIEEEVCVTTVKLEEEEREVRSCSFHPVTLCRESADRGCVTVNRQQDY